MSLEQKVADEFIRQELTLSSAESCTGGLLSHRLTNIPGSSIFFKGGFILYSNESKIRFLNIPKKIFQQNGAVSEEASTLLAQNVRKKFQTDFGIGITGIAGPSGGSFKKPVGLTFITVSTPKETLCLKCQFKGNRLQIKSQTASQALRLLLEFLT